MPSADWKVEIVTDTGEADYSVTVIGDQVVDIAGASDGDLLGIHPAGIAVARSLADWGIAELADVVTKALFDAHSLLVAAADDTPAALTMGASTILARLAAGGIVAATPLQLRTLLGLEVGGYVSNEYYGPKGAATSTRTFSNGTLRCVPYFVRSQQTFATIGVEVAVAGLAGTVFRLGIWNHDPARGMPGTLIIDGGTVAGDAAPGTIAEATINQALAPGWYWLGAAAQSVSGAPTLRAYTGGAGPADLSTNATAGTSMSIGNHYAYGSITGAFASLAAATPTSSSPAPAILLKAA